jgi:molecular chaperone GrpE
MNDHDDIEDLLARFRQWLADARLEADRLDRFADGPGAEPTAAQAELGIVDLVEEFTALRHELKLQTKSGRALLDQTETILAALRQAVEQFRSVEPKEAQAAWLAGKPLAEALADLDEALDRGSRAIETARHRIAEESIAALEQALNDRFRRQSWVRRRMTRRYHQAVLEVVREAAQVRRDFFDSLQEGYGLIQNRLRRVMKAERVERIECEGRPVDPQRMTVIEVVEQSQRPPGTVVKELRRGYTWRDRILRYAEVQAASTVQSRPLLLPGAPRVGLEQDGHDDTDPAIDHHDHAAPAVDRQANVPAEAARLDSK